MERKFTPLVTIEERRNVVAAILLFAKNHGLEYKETVEEAKEIAIELIK